MSALLARNWWAIALRGAFAILFGLGALFSGVLMAVAGFRLHGTHGRWWLVLTGALSVMWGALLYLSPVTGALVLTWWLGGYALAFGALLLVLAVRLRGRRDAQPPAVGAAA